MSLFSQYIFPDIHQHTTISDSRDITLYQNASQRLKDIYIKNSLEKAVIY